MICDETSKNHIIYCSESLKFYGSPKIALKPIISSFGAPNSKITELINTTSKIHLNLLLILMKKPFHWS